MSERKEADFLHAGELAVDRPNRKSRAGISLFPIRIGRKAAAVTAILAYAFAFIFVAIGLGVIGAVLYLCRRQGCRALFYIVRIEVKQRLPAGPTSGPTDPGRGGGSAEKEY